MQSLPEHLESWLRAFAGAVRARDFDLGKTLFDERVVSFGTACFRAEGLSRLVADQWNAVWPNTEGFDFDYDSCRAFVDAAQAVVIANWNSSCVNGDRAVHLRRGRVTIVLQKHGANWRAVHTHFSLEPSPKHDPVLRHQ